MLLDKMYICIRWLAQDMYKLVTTVAIRHQCFYFLDGKDSEDTPNMNSPHPRWCHYLYCCLTHSSCIEVTHRWWLVYVKKDGESASSVHAIFGISICPMYPADHMMYSQCAAHPYRPCVLYLPDCFTELQPDSQFLYCARVCTFLCHILQPKVSLAF